LIGALPNIAKEAFNRIGAANRAMHDRWEGIKGQKMLFVFSQAAYGFGITLTVFGFEGCHIQLCVLFLLLLPDPCQFRCDLLLLAL